MASELPGEPWVAQIRVFLHEVCFFPLSQRESLALLEEASARRSEWAFDLASRLKFRRSVSTLACPRWVLALPPSFLKAPEELPEPILGLALTATRGARHQCTGQIGPFLYGGAPTKFSAALRVRSNTTAALKTGSRDSVRSDGELLGPNATLTISAKPVGVGAASQPWILTGE
jgi:hypothetical protein